jgi:bacterioferritin
MEQPGSTGGISSACERVYDDLRSFLPAIPAPRSPRHRAERGSAQSKELTMKGKPEVIKVLQEALTDELGAVHGYILHAEMCDNWGYKTLAAMTTRRAIEEMKHAERLMERILFLDGAPDVETMPKIVAGQDVEEQFQADLRSEQAAIASYNEGIATCRKAGDDGSAELLKANLQDEERHADYLETQLSLMSQVGLANYLAQTMKE